MVEVKYEIVVLSMHILEYLGTPKKYLIKRISPVEFECLNGFNPGFTVEHAQHCLDEQTSASGRNEDDDEALCLVVDGDLSACLVR